MEADTPEEQAVADAWFAYWDARVASFFKAKVDPRLGTVAAGEAVADVVQLRDLPPGQEAAHGG